MIRAVAEHIYKVENKLYPEDIQKDLDIVRGYIKPIHIVGEKKDADGEVVELTVDSIYNRTYRQGKIYFDAQSGDLFIRTSAEGKAIIFAKVIPNE